VTSPSFVAVPGRTHNASQHDQISGRVEVPLNRAGRADCVSGNATVTALIYTNQLFTNPTKT